jgi:hypothetical protein
MISRLIRSRFGFDRSVRHDHLVHAKQIAEQFEGIAADREYHLQHIAKGAGESSWHDCNCAEIASKELL